MQVYFPKAAANESLFFLYYLKIKGFSNNQLAANFQEIEKANQNINEILENNPDAVLKKIEYKYLDKEKKQLQFEIKIEVVDK